MSITYDTSKVIPGEVIDRSDAPAEPRTPAVRKVGSAAAVAAKATGRGLAGAGRRWVDGYTDGHRQMIETAKAELAAAKGDASAEAAARAMLNRRREEYRQHRKRYLAKTSIATGGVGLTATVGGLAIGGWVDAAMAITAMAVGAWHGRAGAADDDPNPLAKAAAVERDPAGVLGEYDLVTGLIKAGIVTEAQRDETHIVGVIEPSGPGWAATVELPRGMEAATAVSRLDKLASSLRIKSSRVELRADTSEEGHEGRFKLWVSNEENPYGMGKPPSPLVRAEEWDFWRDGIPLGTDPRGARYSLELVWSSLLIGGLQGFGKSFLARLVASAAALDPSLTLHVATGKAGPDWAATKHVARSYVAGSTPAKIHEFLDLLNGLIADMQKIGEELEALSEDDPVKCPEGKLTPELAKERKLGLTLLVVDELQELLDAAALMKIKTDDDPESKAQGRSGKDVLVETMARFVRVSRYAGGMGLFITQRPDADSVPTKLRDVCAKRACFRVKGANSSKMVLGDDAVAAGAAPHMLLDYHKGVFVLDAGGVDGHVALKADVIELPEFKDINLRGRDLRIKAGTLTGFAEQLGAAAVTKASRQGLLADCAAVVEAAGTDRARTKTLLGLLVAHSPDRYADLTEAQLQDQLRPVVGGTKKIGAVDDLKNANGYLLADLRGAAA